MFLFLLVDDCILMYLEITILCIYNFLIPYGCLFGGFFSLYSDPCYRKILGPSLVYVLAMHGNFVFVCVKFALTLIGDSLCTFRYCIPVKLCKTPIHSEFIQKVLNMLCIEEKLTIHSHMMHCLLSTYASHIFYWFYIHA